MKSSGYLGWLLRLLPREFRARHGTEVQALFDDMARALEGAPRWRRLRLYVLVTFDVGRRVVTRRARPRVAWGPGGSWRRDLGRDLAYALVAMRRAPAFAGVVVLTLAIGIGANVAIFTVVRGVLLRPLPYPSPDRLVAVFNVYPTLDARRGAQAPGDLWDYREQTDAIDSYESISLYPQVLSLDGVPQRASVLVMTEGFLPLLGVEPILGRHVDATDDHDAAVITYGYWQQALGGDRDVLGRRLPFDNAPKTVIGVLPEGFTLVMPAVFELPATPQIFTPIPKQGWLGPDGRDRTAHWMHVVGRLGPGRTIEEAQAQLDAVAVWQRANIPRRAERLAEVEVVPLHTETVGEVRSTLVALTGAVSLVLLIACANVANLLVARARHREREVAVRAAIGGTRGRIVRQLLVEGLMLSVLGGVLGTLMAWAGVNAILALAPAEIPRLGEVRIDVAVAGFLAGITLLAALLFSLVPALRASRPDLAGVLTRRDAGVVVRPGLGLRRSLVVFEVALSVVLLVVSGLLLQTIVALSHVDPGLRTERVLTFELSPTRELRDTLGQAQFYREAQDVIASVSGVEGAASVWPTPLSGLASGSSYTATEDGSDLEQQRASSQLVLPGYFATAEIPLTAGRTFGPNDGNDVVIVDETLAARVWPDENAVGRRLQVGWWSGPVWGTVIGVVAPARTHAVNEDNPPTLYRLAPFFAYSSLTLYIPTRVDPTTLVEPIRCALSDRFPTVPLTNVRTMTALVDAQMAPTQFVFTLIGVFSATALGLATVGLYGLISFLVGQRSKEIGIRLALGARRRAVFGLVMRQGLALTVVGLVLGSAATLGVSRVLETWLFGVSSSDPFTIGGICLLFLSVAGAACYLPARRAMRIDPLAAIREE